ncbi:hypothetical protein SAY86_004686 [Trapa natans]|uniref:Uncharacterized protein n=1 Tax=Trapa natans TaxID=22666 RepID=A0AAN7MGJ5_TRANT|nr:hypothetical protein SAY86_004686 [Trapa natans]
MSPLCLGQPCVHVGWTSWPEPDQPRKAHKCDEQKQYETSGYRIRPVADVAAPLAYAGDPREKGHHSVKVRLASPLAEHVVVPVEHVFHHLRAEWRLRPAQSSSYYLHGLAAEQVYVTEWDRLDIVKLWEERFPILGHHVQPSGAGEPYG